MPKAEHPSNGGHRPGSGRKPTSNQQIFVTITSTAASLLERAAKARGLCRRRGGKPFLGTIISELAERHIQADEPEYLRLAREVRGAIRGNGA